MIEALLLAVTRVHTMSGDQVLSSATGFFFERDQQLFLITNRHVVLDEASDHRPDGLKIELHLDEGNIVEMAPYSIPLHEGDMPVWREARDSSGTVDIVAIRLDRDALPESMAYQAFSPAHLVQEMDRIEVGAPLLIAGFPLGFHDTLHHLPVARQAVVASAFGLRFQGNGYFLTDGRMHRGASGSPVVTRLKPVPGRERLPWTLVGVHASRFDVGTRDMEEDEALGLNCAWYTDVLMTLTEAKPATAAPAGEPAVAAPTALPEGNS